MDNRKYTVIMFDFFGVICSEILPAWFAKYFSGEEAQMLKEQYVAPSDTGEISEQELLNNLSALVGKSADEIDQEFYSLVKINHEVVSLILDLKTSYKIVLCSNASSDFLRKVLKENNLERLFDHIIISSEIKLAKPNPDFFKKAMEIACAQPQEILFIDDNPKNVVAAKYVGIDSFTFTNIESLNFLKN